MAEWPTATDFTVWTEAHTADVNDPIIIESVAAAVAHITARCVTFAAGEVPEPVRLAALMLAARWHRRKDTPAGVAAFGGDQAAGVIRYDLVDKDVENLIFPWTPYPVGSA